MPAPRPVKEPGKELRFTRARFAVLSGSLGVVFLLAALLIIYVCSHLYQRDGQMPEQPALWWALPPLALAMTGLHLARLFARHAYVLLTPLGFEILPLIRPSRRMRAIFWPELKNAEAQGQTLILHIDSEETPRIQLSLGGFPGRQQKLLMRAIKGRLDQSAGQH